MFLVRYVAIERTGGEASTHNERLTENQFEFGQPDRLGKKRSGGRTNLQIPSTGLFCDISGSTGWLSLGAYSRCLRRAEVQC